jgi:predicted metal-binding membrane protein
LGRPGAGRPGLRWAGASRHHRVLLPLLAALVALAWAALWAWAASPYARYLEHGDWLADGPVAALCGAIPGGTVLVPAALVGFAWVLMITAMMLPTTLPLFDAFDRLTTGRADRARLLTLLGLGYLGAWGAFGVLAHAAHSLLLTQIDAWPGVAAHAWLIGAATIAGAGAFQFSRLKQRCLDKCRTPLSFVIEHWRGRQQALQAFVLGAHHGLYCVGCCWALMLLMFVVGAGSLGWMLVLAALMAIEKNFAWGRRLSAPLGLGLLGWAALLVLIHA